VARAEQSTLPDDSAGPGACDGSLQQDDADHAAAPRRCRRLAGAGRLLAWTAEGIVIQNEDAVWLLGESGEVRAEIRFREGAPASLQGR